MSLVPRRETPDFKRPEKEHSKETLGTQARDLGLKIERGGGGELILPDKRALLKMPRPR